MSDQLDNDRDITWRVLREMIDAMPAEHLDDRAELLPGNEHNEPIALHKIIGFKSIKEWSTCAETGEAIENYTRSAVDNKHHPERYALLADVNPFDEDGNCAYQQDDFDEEVYTGIPTGNVYVYEEVPTTELRRRRVDNKE